MPYKFSPSTLSLFKECKRCFWLQFNKGIKRPESIFPSLPSGMDRVLKQHFDFFRDKHELPPELKPIEGEAELFSDAGLLEQWRDYKKGLKWKDEQGNTLCGAVDNLLESEKEGKLIVLDYKTRGYPVKDDTHLHYKEQLEVYNFLLKKNGFETEEYAYLLFYYPLRVNPAGGEVVFDTQLVKVQTDTQNAEKIFNSALELLSKECPEKGGCAWCGRIEKPNL